MDWLFEVLQKLVILNDQGAGLGHLVMFGVLGGIIVWVVTAKDA